MNWSYVMTPDNCVFIMTKNWYSNFRMIFLFLLMNGINKDGEYETGCRCNLIVHDGQDQHWYREIRDKVWLWPVFEKNEKRDIDEAIRQRIRANIGKYTEIPFLFIRAENWQVKRGLFLTHYDDVYYLYFISGEKKQRKIPSSFVSAALILRCRLL